MEGDGPPQIDSAPANEVPLSLPVTGLEPGTTYRYQVCAGDAENPDPDCSRTQTFKTAGTGVQTLQLKNFCTDPGDFSQEAIALNFEPNTAYGFRVQFVGDSGFAATFFTTDDAGNYGIGNASLRAPFRAHIVIWRTWTWTPSRTPARRRCSTRSTRPTSRARTHSRRRPASQPVAGAGPAPRAVFTPNDR